MKTRLLPIAAQIVLVVFAAATHAVSWLDESYWPLAWLGLASLYCVLRGKSNLAAIAYGFLFGVVMLSISFHWAVDTLAYTLDCESGETTPILVFAALVLWESIPFAFLSWIFAIADRERASLWLTPLSWVIVEAFWPRVFPWAFAHSQTGFPAFLQVAEMGGASVVTFAFVSGCVGVSQLAARRNSSNAFQAEIMVAVPVLCIAFGLIRVTQLEDPMATAASSRSLTVGVVQIDPTYIDSPAKMQRAVASLKTNPDLLILPESTLGTYANSLGSLQEIREDVAVARPPFIAVEPLTALKTNMIVGGRSFSDGCSDSGPFHQSAYAVDPNGRFISRYHKRHLLPIGEYVPFESQFPMLHEWAQLNEYIAAGVSDAPIRLDNDVSVGVLICYEDTIPSAARTTVLAGAQLLTSIINASAFDSPIALQQHRRLSQLRSVENRRTFIRCGATGESCVISPTGALVQSVPMHEEHVFLATVRLHDQITLFTRLGYLLPYACLAAVGILACGRLIQLQLLIHYLRRLRLVRRASLSATP